MDEEYDVIVLGTGLTVSSQAAFGAQKRLWELPVAHFT